MISKTTNITKTKRESNIELLRILCMVILIIHHCVVHGGITAIEPCITKNVVIPFVPVGKIAFDCFLAISTWFLVERSFKTQKFLKIWLEILFYNVLFWGVAKALGADVGLRILLGSFFPIIGNSHGFAATYLIFYLLLPFLNIIAKSINKKQARFLMYLLLYVQVISQVFEALIEYQQPISSEVLLFVLFYFIALNLKKWPYKITNSKKVLLLLFLGVWILFTLGWYLLLICGVQSNFLGFLMNTSGSESSLNNIIAGWALFLLVKQIKMKYSAWINKLATFTFGILLMHDHNFFRPVLWDQIVKVNNWSYLNTAPFLILIVAILIFAIGCIIDYIRQSVFERWIINTISKTSICERIDGIININY